MATIKEWKHTNGYEVGETLPSVSASDNGKVLGVSDGAWAVVSGGGGGGSEPLLVDYDDETGIEASYNEIKTAMLAGKNVYAVNNWTDSASSGTNYYKILSFSEDSVNQEGVISHNYFVYALEGVYDGSPAMFTFYSLDADADMGFYSAGD